MPEWVTSKATMFSLGITSNQHANWEATDGKSKAKYISNELQTTGQGKNSSRHNQALYRYRWNVGLYVALECRHK